MEDAAAGGAEFTRNCVEADRAIASMRAETSENNFAITTSRIAIADSRDMLKQLRRVT